MFAGMPGQIDGELQNCQLKLCVRNER